MKGFVFSAYGICVSILCISLAGCTNPSTRPTQFTTATSRGNGAVTTPLSAPGGTPSQANTDCVGDDEPLAVTPGWKLLWQHVFEHPITRPPEITDSQVIIVERADPFSGEGIDTVWALNPQTSATQWRFEGTNDVAAYEFRHVINLHWSQKYVVLHVQYGTLDSAPPYASGLD